MPAPGLLRLKPISMFLNFAAFLLLAWPLAGEDPVTAACRNLPGQSFGLHLRAIYGGPHEVLPLSLNDFTLTDNKQIRDLCGFSHIRQPLSLGVVIDSSGSMRMAGPLSQVMVEFSLKSASPQDEFFLAVTNYPALSYAFTRDRQQILESLPKAVFGGTSLYDSVYVALDSMKNARYPNRALLIISDGVDTESRHSSKDLLTRALASRTPIFAIVPHAKHEPVAGSRQLRDVAEQSGGFARLVQSLEEATKWVGPILYAMREPYMVYFQTPTGAPTPERRQLRVELKTRKVRFVFADPFPVARERRD